MNNNNEFFLVGDDYDAWNGACVKCGGHKCRIGYFAGMDVIECPECGAYFGWGSTVMRALSSVIIGIVVAVIVVFILDCVRWAVN